MISRRSDCIHTHESMMEFGPVSPFSPVGTVDGHFPHFLPPLSIPGVWPSQITRLRNEKDILENGLANCVTYLHVLRKKKTRNEILLNTSPALPRKKRKKVEQNNREITHGIKNCERDEQAYLNNLQACKASLLMAENLSYTPTELSSIVLDQHSATTRGSLPGSETTEFSWNGWTEDAVVSPFQRENQTAFLDDEIAPEQPIEALNSSWNNNIDIKIKRPPPLSRATAETIRVLPVPPNTAQSAYLHSTLSPQARVFEPISMHAIRKSESPRQHMGQLKASLLSPTKCAEIPQQRRTTFAGIAQVLQRQFEQAQPNAPATHTWCTSLPEQSRRKTDTDHILRKSRTNSL